MAKTKTLNQIYRAAQRKADWLGKLHKNCGKTLSSVRDIVELDRSSHNPPKEGQPRMIVLNYIGKAGNIEEFAKGDLLRLERRFGALFNGNLNAPVQFGRITLTVSLKLPFQAELQRAA